MSSSLSIELAAITGGIVGGSLFGGLSFITVCVLGWLPWKVWSDPVPVATPVVLALCLPIFLGAELGSSLVRFIVTLP